MTPTHATDELVHSVIGRIRTDWAGQDRAEEVVRGVTPVEFHVSPERYLRILKWQQDPSYGQVPYEALYPGGDPEEPDPPLGRDIDAVPIANACRLNLKIRKSLSNSKKSVEQQRRSDRFDFDELFVLIHDFRRGALNDLTPLVKALRWQPQNDPYTRQRFRELRGRGVMRNPELYTQLVEKALEMMRDRKPEKTPQSVRLNRRWVTSSQRKLVPFDDLPVAYYIRWFRNEITKLISNEILGADRYRKKEPAFVTVEGTETADGGWESSPLDHERVERWRRHESAKRDRFSEEERLDDESLPASPAKPAAIESLRTIAEGVRRLGVTLSPLQRQILDLAEEQGSAKNYRDISDQLGRTRETVKNAILRIRRKIARLVVPPVR